MDTILQVVAENLSKKELLIAIIAPVLIYGVLKVCTWIQAKRRRICTDGEEGTDGIEFAKWVKFIEDHPIKLIVAMGVFLLLCGCFWTYSDDSINGTTPTSSILPMAQESIHPSKTVSPVSSFMVPTPSIQPQCPEIKSCKEVKMTLQHLLLIKIDNDQSRLLDILYPYWMSFWAMAGFLPGELKAQIPRVDVNSYEKIPIFHDWIAGKFEKQVPLYHPPTYAGLVQVLRKIWLNKLADEVEDAITFNKDLNPDDRIQLHQLMSLKYKDKKINVLDRLEVNSFAQMIGYNIERPNVNEQAFKLFFTKWLQQSLNEQSRKKYPANFEGFRAILKDNELHEYCRDFEKAVLQECFCQF